MEKFGTNGNSTIAAFSGGNNGSNTNRIGLKYITSGNNTDFGDLTQSYRYQYVLQTLPLKIS